jgi:hypothetical protein
MEFKYEMKAEDGSELFEEGVLLARQYLGVGDWHVWDLRPNSSKNCKQCSSRAERLVIHDRGTRCPGVTRGGGGAERIALARDAIARRDARVRDAEIAAVVRRAQELDNEAREADAEEVQEERAEEVEAEEAEEAEEDQAVGADEEDVQGTVFDMFNYFYPLI